jgi:hypothetical protein
MMNDEVNPHLAFHAFLSLARERTEVRVQTI